MGWPEIIKIALTSSLLTSIVTCGFNYIVDARKSQKGAKYLAQRVALILEKFASECAKMISENELYDSSAGNAGSKTAKLPELQPLPTDTDWKTVQAHFVNSILSLPIHVSLAQERVASWWDTAGDEENTYIEANAQAGRLGSEAWDLALKLRRHYSIPESQLAKKSWDFISLLKTHGDPKRSPSFRDEV